MVPNHVQKTRKRRNKSYRKNGNMLTTHDDTGAKCRQKEKKSARDTRDERGNPPLRSYGRQTSKSFCFVPLRQSLLEGRGGRPRAGPPKCSSSRHTRQPECRAPNKLVPVRIKSQRETFKTDLVEEEKFSKPIDTPI